MFLLFTSLNIGCSVFGLQTTQTDIETPTLTDTPTPISTQIRTPTPTYNPLKDPQVTKYSLLNIEYSKGRFAEYFEFPLKNTGGWLLGGYGNTTTFKNFINDGKTVSFEISTKNGRTSLITTQVGLLLELWVSSRNYDYFGEILFAPSSGPVGEFVVAYWNDGYEYDYHQHPTCIYMLDIFGNGEITSPLPNDNSWCKINCCLHCEKWNFYEDSNFTKVVLLSRYILPGDNTVYDCSKLEVCPTVTIEKIK